MKMKWLTMLSPRSRLQQLQVLSVYSETGFLRVWGLELNQMD